MFSALRADNSPFTEQQIKLLQEGLGGLDTNQSVWLSGFIAGRLSGLAEGNAPSEAAGAVQALPAAAESKRLQVFYASQTGNGEDIARQLAAEAQQAGLKVEVQSLAALRPAALKKMEYAAFVISTHGEGDPPDDAIDLFEYLEGPRAASLEKLKFRVLALGDRSYSKFCEAGRKLEALLEKQGAVAFDERIECDIDFQQAASSWSSEIIRFGQENLATVDQSSAAVNSSPGHLSIVPPTARWTRSNPFTATVERVQKITALESEKDVYHVELSLEDSGIDYQPGDALGVWAPNRHELVNEVLSGLDIDPEESIELDEHRHTMHELLTRRRELTRLSPDTVQGYALLAQNEELQHRFEHMEDNQRRDFIEQRQFIDLLAEYPVQSGARISGEDLASLLRPLAPRSYSIASSMAAVDEEVHLTVATLYSGTNGAQRTGVASDYLNHRLEAGDEVGVFPEPNRRFRLPDDRGIPLILVSAGTGIAPYRAFLQQLEAENERPETWLIFGNPHLRTDFLYQREWLDWRQKGLITRIDGAFSRDQADKRYVQHVLLEQGELIEQWLSNKARVYICGGLAMGQEVETALREVLAAQRGLDASEAAEHVADLRREGRLLKDLY